MSCRDCMPSSTSHVHIFAEAITSSPANVVQKCGARSGPNCSPLDLDGQQVLGHADSAGTPTLRTCNGTYAGFYNPTYNQDLFQSVPMPGLHSMTSTGDHPKA